MTKLQQTVASRKTENKQQQKTTDELKQKLDKRDQQYQIAIKNVF